MDLARLRRNLERARDRGVPFDVAWTGAVRVLVDGVDSRIERTCWTIALNSTREAWERSYSGEEPTRHDQAPGRLAALRS